MRRGHGEQQEGRPIRPFALHPKSRLESSTQPPPHLMPPWLTTGKRHTPPRSSSPAWQRIRAVLQLVIVVPACRLRRGHKCRRSALACLRSLSSSDLYPATKTIGTHRMVYDCDTATGGRSIYHKRRNRWLSSAEDPLWEADYAWAFIPDRGEEKFFGAKSRPGIALRRDPLMAVGVVIRDFGPVRAKPATIVLRVGSGLR
jgi:hypothetical protein